jgi:hypothetical protein
MSVDFKVAAQPFTEMNPSKQPPNLLSDIKADKIALRRLVLAALSAISAYIVALLSMVLRFPISWRFVSLAVCILGFLSSIMFLTLAASQPAETEPCSWLLKILHL